LFAWMYDYVHLEELMSKGSAAPKTKMIMLEVKNNAVTLVFRDTMEYGQNPESTFISKDSSSTLIRLIRFETKLKISNTYRLWREKSQVFENTSSIQQ
jgi:hypothetical protein